ARCVGDPLGRCMNDVHLVVHLVCGSDQWHHDVRVHMHARLHDRRGRLEDGLGLHVGDLGVHYAQAAAAQTHHRVDLPQAIQTALHALNTRVQLRSELLAQRIHGGTLLRQELVKRGIQETNGDRQTVHGPAIRNDALVRGKEHVLCP
ncbi:hypothetical protein Vafri_18771, partial [Volvox africanus]